MLLMSLLLSHSNTSVSVVDPEPMLGVPWLKSVTMLEGLVSFIEGWHALGSSLLVDTLLSRRPVSPMDDPRLSSAVRTVAFTVLDRGDDVAAVTIL